MNTEQIKQIVETIKTMNININSATGQKAVEHVADKVGQYLILQAIFQFTIQLLSVLLILILAFLAYKLFVKLSNNDTLKNKQIQVRMALDNLDGNQLEEFKTLFTELVK